MVSELIVEFIQKKLPRIEGYIVIVVLADIILRKFGEPVWGITFAAAKCYKFLAAQKNAFPLGLFKKNNAPEHLQGHNLHDCRTPFFDMSSPDVCTT